MYKLVIQDDEGKTTVVPLIRDEITIGRKEGNTIRLTERNVSRKHARIVRSNGTVAIEDLGSYNGVRVNGTRISQRTPLTVSDRVQIGDYLIELKAEGAEQAAGAPASYEDAKTQPVERVDPGYAQRSTVPLAGGVAPPPHPAAGASQATMPTPPAGVMPGGAPMGADAAQIALSDTDPRMAAAGRPAAVAPVGAMASVSGHARLVILSSNFAGREFELSKPQVVIGRTDDNDVVVNHRSISRNHAKVVREPETGRYTIMDLQSSNGVRVNGEEYGKVELRRGDIVDLGHVRMRFVDVGEDFLFGRDAQAVDVPTGGGKGLFIALGALLVIGGIVGVVMATGGGGGDDKKEPAAVGSENVDAGKIAELPIDAAVPAVKTDDKKINELRTAIGAALEKENWQALFDHCKNLLELVPGDPDCEQKLVQVKREQAAQLKYDDFTKAVQTKSYPGVAKHFRELDNESIYKERARPDHDRMRDDYVAGVRGQAQRYAKAGKCKEIERLAANSEGNWQEAADAAREEAAKCETAVAAIPDKRDDKKDDRKDDRKDDKKDDKKDDGGSSSSGKTAQQLADDAAAAARAGQYGKALRVAEDALKKDSGNQSALTTAAIAACNLKQAEKAKKYINKLSGQRQGMVRQVCLRNNVSID